VVEQSLWAAVPSFLRRLSAALKKHTGRELPLNATPIKFGSWMGGDRDGNPNVTAKTTHHVVALSRCAACWHSLPAGCCCYDLQLMDNTRLKVAAVSASCSLLKQRHLCAMHAAFHADYDGAVAAVHGAAAAAAVQVDGC
jgi:phosphoenolpyruvate carboxylase